MFLTRAELAELTGYQLPAWQIRWLRAHDWQFEQAVNGRPIVSRAHAEQRLAGATRTLPAVALNLEVIRKRA